MNRRGIWLAVAAVLLTGSIGAGVALTLAPNGTVDQRLRPDKTVTVAVDPDEPLIVWSPSNDDVRCEVEGLHVGMWSMTKALWLDGQWQIRVGGQTLHAVLDVRASPAGTYELTCTGDAVAVGTAPWSYRMRKDLPSGLPLDDRAWAVAAALPALLAAVIVALVLLSRRRAKSQPARSKAQPARSEAQPG